LKSKSEGQSLGLRFFAFEKSEQHVDNIYTQEGKISLESWGSMKFKIFVKEDIHPVFKY